MLALACVTGSMLLPPSASIAQSTTGGPQLLPDVLAKTPGSTAANKRAWTVNDTVEIARITDIAVRGNSRTVAFVVLLPSIAEGENRYGLYVIDAAGSAPARKIAESSFLGGLAWRPNSTSWTIRGDFGEGVQLYEIASSGQRRPLVVNPELARVGGDDGLVGSCCDGPHATGVLAYGWSPNGETLWYTRLRLHSPEEQKSIRNRGLVWDGTHMAPVDFHADLGAKLIELHAFNPGDGRDRIVATAAGDRTTASFAFSLSFGSVGWAAPNRLWYRVESRDTDGHPSFPLWVFDIQTGQVERADLTASPFGAIPTARGILSVRNDKEGQRQLVELATNGKLLHDYGKVDFALAGSEQVWRVPGGGSAIYGARFNDRDGLAVIGATVDDKPLTRVKDSLGPCAFNSDLSFGACSRESLTKAPELVSVSSRRGIESVLARPNARYEEIAPLRTERIAVTNKLGTVSNSYVTYPRAFKPGRRYPALLVTHGVDARNLFAYDGFQWSFPIQVFAERGYVVLSVTDRPSDREALQSFGDGASKIPVERMQKAIGFDAIATMEAAANWAIDQGIADRDRIGIAGYSRGAIVTTLALSQSKMFAAGAMADSSFFNAGTYWANTTSLGVYKSVFGGSPFDPKFFPNYLAFSPTARAQQFSGPLLQLHTGENAPYAVELDQMLREAHVPTELVFFPGETHVLYNPRTRAAAAQRSFEWFDYWLMQKRSAAPLDSGEYARWTKMAEAWRRNAKPAPYKAPPE